MTFIDFVYPRLDALDVFQVLRRAHELVVLGHFLGLCLKTVWSYTSRCRLELALSKTIKGLAPLDTHELLTHRAERVTQHVTGSNRDLARSISR